VDKLSKAKSVRKTSPVGIEPVIYCMLCQHSYYYATTAAEIPKSKSLFILACIPSEVP